MKKLYRSKDDRMVAGVIGGLGEYANVESTLLRVLFVVFVIFTGIFPGVLLYVVLIFIIPERPKGKIHDVEDDDEPDGPPFRPWQ